MEYQQIRVLLERYFEGRTSLEEEAQLRRYFAEPQIDARLREYAPLFQWMAHESRQTLPETVPAPWTEVPEKQQSFKLLSLRWMARVAAALVLLVGMWWAFQQPAPETTAAVDWSKYEITDERQALEITRRALLQVSGTLNRGAGAAAGQMDRVQEMGKFFD